ncbi:hypothetical protein [Kitasatospora cathayae]|uniref:Uncharacterized protein n=1 Tax=Kitasatospora cathayae TaxID=3004092 RepID=A0ABY7Q5N4_9ACTN|nr:hypothetical protein [Kitasatospora sp. HUAS 3-15]WBP87944.1 hypothetical protein O1G21_20255 [Kitasatospora sp. HUAS 3-15]
MTDEPGPAERARYLAAVRGGGRPRPEDLAPADRPAVAALVARGLLTPTTTAYTAANPRALVGGAAAGVGGAEVPVGGGGVAATSKRVG